MIARVINLVVVPVAMGLVLFGIGSATPTRCDGIFRM